MDTGSSRLVAGLGRFHYSPPSFGAMIIVPYKFCPQSLMYIASHAMHYRKASWMRLEARPQEEFVGWTCPRGPNPDNAPDGRMPFLPPGNNDSTISSAGTLP